MEWGTPALVFLTAALIIGGACLVFLKRRFRNSQHHLLILVVVGAVIYLSQLQIKTASELVSDRLMRSWMGVARTYAHGLERSTENIASLDAVTMRPAILRANNRLGIETLDSHSATVIFKDAEKGLIWHTVGLHQETDLLSNKEIWEEEVLQAFTGHEQWCESRNPLGQATDLVSLVPLRDDMDVIQGVLLVEFVTERWNQLHTREQWRVVGEFSGFLVICLCLGAFLVVYTENRKKKDLEEAIKPLLQDIASLDGMVNSVQGVVWERPASSSKFSHLSHNADGYLGYSLDRWSSESEFLEQIIHSEDRDRVKAAWKQSLKDLTKYHIEYRVVRPDGTTAFVSEHGQATKQVLDGKGLRGILLDVTAQREAEAHDQSMHKMMIEASRQAGMAEIATGVLHNVGNVLNSLNVGAKLLSERLKKSRLDKLCQATQLLKDHLPENPEFFTQDKRGLALPGYLVDLSAYLRDEQSRLDAAVSDMIERIEHIRDMIMLQQSHSTVRTLWEQLDLATVMEDALKLEMDVNIAHQQVQVQRHFADIPPIYSARGLLLQILVNLLANACQAMADKPVSKRKLTLRLVPHEEEKIILSVEDTGCGIHPRHLTSIFTQGFTTKKDGHGFGLHHACLLAQDLGGMLRAESDGLGKGARFILEIPARKDSKSGSPPTASASASKAM